MNTAEGGQVALEVAVIPVVRRMAAALRGEDRVRLAASLSAAVRLFPELSRAWLQVNETPAAPGAGSFPADVLTLPVRSAAEVVGTLHQPVGDAGLGGGHLQLLAAMAELAGAILERSPVGPGDPGGRALLAFVLEQMPVGAVLFSADRHILAANARASALLEKGVGAAALLGPSLETAAGANRPPSVQLALCAGRTLVVHLHPAPAGPGKAAATLVLFHDLTQKVAEFSATVAREAYRALWTGQPMTLLLLSLPDDVGRLVETIERVRTGAGGAGLSGPVDARVFGLALPGWRVDALRQRLRADKDMALPPDMQVAAVELGERETPEQLLGRAMAALAPGEGLLRPALLLYDTSPSVTDALEVVLGREMEVVVCHDREEGTRLLARRLFDAIFANIEPDQRQEDVAFVRGALEAQPRLAAFLLSSAPGPYQRELEGLPAETPVFRKPFAVRVVREAVRQALAERGA